MSTQTISIIQIVIAVILIVIILLQQRDSDTSSFLGGGGGSGVYQQRRGVERFLFILTIVLVVVFAGLALTSLLYHGTPTEPSLTVTPVDASSTPITAPKVLPKQ